MKTPDLKPTQMNLELGYVNKLLGLELSPGEVKDHLERMRYGVEVEGDNLSVSVPSYRTDILHPIDLVEDVAIAYGYHNFQPSSLIIHTRVSEDSENKSTGLVRDVLVGSGFMEVKTLIMTNKKALFEQMNVSEAKVTEAENPASTEHSVCRNWLLPSLMSVLAKNRTREFPQRVFEVGDIISGDGVNSVRVAGVVSHARTNYSEIKSLVMGVYSSLGVELEGKAAKHKSFIEGRCAKTKTGFYGEIHPKVLSNYGLEMPVTAFEVSLSELSTN